MRTINVTISLLAFTFIMSISGWCADDDQVDLAELSIEELLEVEVIYAASKHEQSIQEAPASISIITADEIRQYGYRYLGDILTSVNGFYSSYDRTYHYMGVRGFSRLGDYNSRVLILINGMRINDNIYDTGPVGRDFSLDLDLIDRIEIIRGPGASLYGTNAVFGVVNVITRDGREFNGFEGSVEAGSFGTYQERVTIGKQFDSGLSVMLSGSNLDSEGQDFYYEEFDDPDHNYGISVSNDEEYRYSLFALASYKDLSLQGSLNSRKKYIPTGSWGVVYGNHQTFEEDKIGLLSLKYNHLFLDVYHTNLQVYYGDYSYEGEYYFDYAEEGENPFYVIFQDYSGGNWLGAELNISRNYAKKHTITVGGEYRNNFRQNQSGRDADPLYIYLDDHRSSYFWAVFAQDEFKVTDKLLINAGLRNDYYSTFGSTINPRLAVIIKPATRTNLKLLYGKSFRAPNTYELYYGDGGESQKGNPDLSSESVNTYELVLEQIFNEDVVSTASVFKYEIENLITQTTDPEDDLIVFENIESVKAMGFEVELKCNLEFGLQTRTGYTYQKTEDEVTGEWLTNSPEHLFHINASLPIVGRKLSLGVDSRLMSQRLTPAGNESDSYFITNATILSRQLIPGLDLSATVYNVFDVEYYDLGGEELLQDLIQQDVRNYRIKATYAF